MTPLLGWLIPDVVEKFRSADTKKYWFVLAWLVGGAGIFLSLSRGAWLGLAIVARGGLKEAWTKTKMIFSVC